MKRKWMALLSVALAFLLPLPVFAAELDTELEGLVKEVTEEGFLMEDAQLGEVWLNTDETTVWDGILAEGELEVGQYVLVRYDGRLTRSLPPQAHADRVGCYVLNGTVEAFYDSGVLLTGDENFGDVIVHLEESLAHVYIGMPVTVYYDGIMMMSLPGQVNARHIVVPSLTGTVSERDGEGFTLTDAEGQAYQVLLTEETLVTLAHEGEPENAEETANVPEGAEPEEEQPASEPEETADEEPTGNETPADEEATADEADAVLDGESEVSLEWGDGDVVTVLYNGVLSKSNPAQLTALEVQVEQE